jgi:hypothetical protein
MKPISVAGVVGVGRVALITLATLALFWADTDSARAQDVLLHSFGGGSSDGSTPYAGLLQANDGNLYGVMVDGGSAGIGRARR